MAKRRRKRVKTFREPVPGELERDEESWSGLKVTGACVAMSAVLFLGLLAWKNLYAAGIAGAISPFLWAIYRHFHQD